MDDETIAQVQSEAPSVEETAPASTSDADVQTNNETPEAPQTNGEESAVKAEETVEEKLYAGKYKTAEDLEKAYLSAQSEASRISQEKADLTKILASGFMDEPAPQAQAQADDYSDYDDDSTPQSNPATLAMERRFAVMEFAMSNPDADGAAIMDVIKNDPFVAQLPSYEAKLKYAHALSQNTARPKAVAEAKKQAQAETQAKIAEKQAAQVESATKQSPPTKEEPLTKEQLREALRSDDGFNALLKKRPGFKNYLG